MTTVLLAGGGSGGHVFPLVAIAHAVRAADSSAKVVFVGTSQGMEATILPPRGEQLELLRVFPIKGGGVAGAARGVARAAAVLPEARKLVERIAPDVVLSIGGYAAGPVSLAARTMGLPLALLEPNSVPGLSNRLLSPFVRRAYLVFPEAARRFRASVVRQMGLPIRDGFAPSPYSPVEGRARVVILGGSQGAAALNEAAPGAIVGLVKLVPGLSVLHQAGRGKDAEVRARYQALGLGHVVEVRDFVDDVASEVREADVVLTRSGAGAICELCAVGRAAIYVPYPFAADDHQRRNAEALAAAGAAICVRQDQASPERLGQELRSLLLSAPRRESLARVAAGRGRPDAARQIARDLLSLVRTERQPTRLAAGG